MDKKIINTIRNLALDMINESKVGNPGSTLSGAATIYSLFANHLVFNKNDGFWLGRDRFIVGSHNTSALLYSVLFLSGYPIDFNDLKNYNKFNNTVSLNPVVNKKIGVEYSCGHCGEGFGIAIGEAIGCEYLKNNVSKELFNYNVYSYVTDADLMEGICYEGASLAGSLKLGSLIVLYESSRVIKDGNCDNVFDDDILKRFEACGWSTESIINAEDNLSIDKAILRAKSIVDKPSIIEIKSIIGIGSKYENTNKVYNTMLESDDLLNIKNKMGVNPVPFYISKDAALELRNIQSKRNDNKYNEWKLKYNAIMNTNNALSKNVLMLLNNKYDINLNKVKMNADSTFEEELTITNGKLMNLLSDLFPLYISASCDCFDLSRTYLKKGEDFKISNKFGKNIYIGKRESLCSDILNGLSLSNIRCNCSLKLSSADAVLSGLRLGAKMNLASTYIFVHDESDLSCESIGTLRSVSNIVLLRPADINEIVGSWNYIINNNKSVCLIISSSKYKKLDISNSMLTLNGAYIIKKEVVRTSGIIIASGCDVHKAIKISEDLYNKGIYIRVVSAPSLELFDNQSIEYRQEVLTPGVKTIALDSSNDKIWHKYVYSSKYIINIDNRSKTSYEDTLNRVEEILK
ncbi:MAG: hypothetical protein RSD00_00820 [Bacilli bacterium]